MLKRLSATILVSIGELGAEAPEARRVRYAVLNGRKLIQQGECTLAQLESLHGRDIRVSFFSRSGYFGRSQAQTANKRLAMVVARRYIDAEMLFTDPYRLRLTTHVVSENEVLLKLVAAAEVDCMRLEDALPLETHPVSLATLEEAAIAALVAKVTVEPAVVMYARAERFLALLVENGEVRQRRMENVTPGDMAAAETAAQRAEMLVGNAMAGELALGGGAAKEAALKIYLGELRPLASSAAAVRDYASREVEKKMAALIKGGDALHEPELFGLSFVARKWSFLEEEQAHKTFAWQAAFPVSLLLLGGALLLGLAFVADMASSAGMASQVESEQQRLLAIHSALAERVPKDQELGRFKELTELLKRRSEQVRVDRLLSWMSREMPAGITISSIQMYLEGDAPPETQVQSGENSPRSQDLLSKFFAPTGAAKEDAAQADQRKAAAGQPGVYVVRLELNLPGSYSTAEELAAETIRRLSPKLQFVRSHLDFDAAENRARLVSELSARAEDFR